MVLTLIRPKHWIKNGFVLMPLIFAGSFMETPKLLAACWAVLYFCIAASAVYVLNDIFDVASDRLHPVKKLKRPLASGACSLRQAYVILGILYALIVTAYWMAPAIFGWVVLYVVMNVAYAWRLKHIPVLDIFVIAAGFVLRVYTGAVAVDVPLSNWMAMTTFSLALFLAVSKRGRELQHIQTDAREALSGYSLVLIDRYAMLSAVCTMMFYSFFIMIHRPALVVTIPFVLAGIFRYWYLVEQKGMGESPTEALYRDMVMIAIILCWLGVVLHALL